MKTFLGALIFTTAFLAIGTVPEARADDGVLTLDSGLAVNSPDEFNWSVFVQINKNAVAKGRPNDVVWETWANDSSTFPKKADLPASGKPAWPDPAKTCKTLVPNVQQAALRELGRLRPFVVPSPNAAQDQQETRRNKVTFDFIVSNGLWSKSGLASAFSSANGIAAPHDSIEIKADWFPAKDGDDTRYHVNTDCENKKWKLVALHIITKALPNWTWVTFEHVDNPGRCDYIGCHDSFGATVPVTNPNSTLDKEENSILSVGDQYPKSATCEKSKEMLALFEANGLDQSVWGNYCLKGSQIDFADLRGNPTRLGNSVTEGGFVRTSSCMTCHSRASFAADGSAPTFAGFIGFSTAPYEVATGPVGYPKPEWFTLADQAQTPSLKQADFIWAFAFAKAISP